MIDQLKQIRSRHLLTWTEVAAGIGISVGTMYRMLANPKGGMHKGTREQVERFIQKRGSRTPEET